jgi:hypothetical protein
MGTDNYTFTTQLSPEECYRRIDKAIWKGWLSRESSSGREMGIVGSIEKDRFSIWEGGGVLKSQYRTITAHGRALACTEGTKVEVDLTLSDFFVGRLQFATVIAFIGATLMMAFGSRGEWSLASALEGWKIAFFFWFALMLIILTLGFLLMIFRIPKVKTTLLKFIYKTIEATSLDGEADVYKQ